MEIKLLELAGFRAAMTALRLPHKGTGDSIFEGQIQSGQYANAQHGNLDVAASDNGLEMQAREILPAIRTELTVAIGPKDMNLASRLVQASDCEAKVMRGIIAWTEIKAPIDWWCELETYRAGHERLCSESTMNDEGKGLKGTELREALNKISFGREIKKVDYFSYQCLRNIWIWRHKHRKDEWRQFCHWIETLPFAEEFILYGLKRD